MPFVYVNVCKHSRVSSMENVHRKKARRKTRRGKKVHWAVWLTFGIALSVIFRETFLVVSAVLVPGA